jgi:amino acid adenylation domain-containing protein/non-ribosomal peptide synthase protein (TIGR01720 family)
MTQIIDSYELSPMQAGMLFHAVSAGRSGIDVEQVLVTLHEPLDEALFLWAWHRVVERHPILRTCFRWTEIDEPAQIVLPRLDIPVEKFDWCALPKDERGEKLESLLDCDRERGFDLSEAPLMRLTFVRSSKTEFHVLWTFHHALLDGRSFPIVLREVFACYESCLHDRTATLQPVRPYREYIDWLRTIDHEAAKPFWQRMLAGFRAPTPMIIARERDTVQDTTSDRGAYEISLDISFTTALRARARDASVTLNTLLQGAWALLLHRYSGEADIVFGATRACRKSPSGGVDEMIGLFINTLPMRVNIDPEFDIESWLQRLRTQQIALREFEHTPLVNVQGWSEVPRGKPLFESILVFENQSLDSQLRALGNNWRQRRFQYRGQTNYPLTVIAYGDEQLQLQIEYSRRHFAGDVVKRMLAHLRTLLEGMADRRAVKLKDLSLLSEAERQQAISGWNQTISYPKGECLQERFEKQVESTPDAIAVIYENESLSYAELNHRANRLAHHLRDLGVVPDQLVGLRIERSIEMVIGILGILKAGGAYLPLDPAYPKDRVAFMLEDSQVAVVVTQKELAADFDGSEVKRVLIDEPLPLRDSNPAPVSTADNLAYVIYTSGSTGKPKGAQITHYNVTRLFEATDPWYHFDKNDVWTLFHSYAFDFSVWELWGALLYGGRVVIVPYWTSRSPEAFRELLLRERVTVLNQTPSAFRQLIQTDSTLPKADLALRYVIFGGEALELQSLRPWFERYGDEHPLLVNMYGITETTVHVTYRPIRQADLESGQGSVIGIPIPDLQVYILDPQGQPAPIGIPGEMYVGGAGVARSYLNRAELTAQRFVQDPFRPEQSAKLYRTGDLARRLENGDIEYLGRIDHQVKIRGFRIELGEIEAGIARHPAVHEVTVLVQEDARGAKRLVAYVAAKDPPPALVDDLRSLILTTMPEYMVPAHFVLLDALPLTENGKVDRQALSARTVEHNETVRNFVAPRTPTEKTLAQIWGAVLGIDKVGVHDHFFELGGDSILSIQVISRCRQAGLQVKPKDLFERPTVAQLAQSCAPATSEVESAQDRLTGNVQLTPIERWFLEQDIAERSHWNQAFLFEVPATIDITLLEQALGRVVQHHDGLRMRLWADGQDWLQEYGDNAESSIIHIDLSDLSIAQRAAAIERHAAEAQRSLNLATGDLIRSVHFSFGPREAGRLLLVIHHIAVDGVSWRVIREDLETAYSDLYAGETPIFPNKTTSYQKWANHLVEIAQSSTLLPSLSYWRAEAVKPVTPLVHGLGDCANLEAEARSLKRQLTREETVALMQGVPSAYHTQINDVLLTALTRSLAHWSGGAAFRIDLEGHGRESVFEAPDVSRTVGWFTTIFPVRLELDANQGIDESLKSIKEQLRRVPDHGMSYGLLRYHCDDSEARVALGQSPRSDILFNYLGQFDQVVAGSKIFAFASEPTGPWHDPRSRRTHALEIICLVRAGKLEIECIFHPKLRYSDDIERLADLFITTLRAIITHCLSPAAGGRTPSDFPLARLNQKTVDWLWKHYPTLHDVYPLSPMQRMFYAMEGTRGDPGFEQWHFRLEGLVDTTILRRSIEQVVARHTILRTAFVSGVDAEPLQVVLQQVTLPWSEEDWRDLDSSEQDERLAVLMESDRRQAFDLTQAPLMRVALRRIDEKTYHLLWSTHHLYIDGWSWPLVFRDVSHIYESLRAATDTQLEDPLPYQNYLAWLCREAPDSERFWQDELVGITGPTALNLDHSPITSDGKIKGFFEECAELNQGTTNALQALARSQHITLSTIVQGVWSLLISHYSGSNDVVFGAAFSGRPAQVPRIESMIGSCVNNLPVRVVVTPEQSSIEWLLQLQQRQFALAQHQYVSLQSIQEWAKVPWRHRLFESLIVFQNYAIDESACRLGSEARLIPITTPENTNYPLTIVVRPNRGLCLRLIYHTDRFRPDVVRTYVADIMTILDAIAEKPPLTIAELMRLLPQVTRGKAAGLTAMKAPQDVARYNAPITETERAIAALWQELFGMERVSIDDNFFDLGGHSLLLLQAHSRLRATVKPDLPVIALLQYPTIRSLGRYLSGNVVPLATATAADRARKQRESLLRQRSMMEKR